MKWTFATVTKGEGSLQSGHLQSQEIKTVYKNLPDNCMYTGTNRDIFSLKTDLRLKSNFFSTFHNTLKIFISGLKSKFHLKLIKLLSCVRPLKYFAFDDTVIN